MAHLPIQLTMRMKRPTLLIVGCGDIGLRVLKLLRGRYRIFALSSNAARREALRAAGAVPLIGNLDVPATLGRLGGIADAVLHLAPPPASGSSDPRTMNLLNALARGGRVRCIVYGSTSGSRMRMFPRKCNGRNTHGPANATHRRTRARSAARHKHVRPTDRCGYR